MRVWDIDPKLNCPPHRRAQHKESHQIRDCWLVKLSGWQYHPETKRWRNHLIALKRKHDQTAKLLQTHNTPFKVPWYLWLLPWQYVTPEPWQSIEKQIELLKAKDCECKV